MGEETLFDHMSPAGPHSKTEDPEHANTPRALRCKTLHPACGCHGCPAAADHHPLAGDGGCSFGVWVSAVAHEIARSAPEDAGLPEGDRCGRLDPLDQGVRLLGVLYARAHDPAGELPIDHRAGYRTEPGLWRVESFSAAGFVEQGPDTPELAYCANHVDLRKLVCRTQQDLEALYGRILASRLP